MARVIRLADSRVSSSRYVAATSPAGDRITIVAGLALTTGSSRS